MADNFDCRIYAGDADELLADGCQLLPAPFEVLSPLKVAWGRETVLDQPDPATATFTITDPHRPPRFMDDLFVGQSLVVRSAFAGSDEGFVDNLPDRYMDELALGQSPPWVLTSATAEATREPYWFPPSSGMTRRNLADAPWPKVLAPLPPTAIERPYPGWSFNYANMTTNYALDIVSTPALVRRPGSTARRVRVLTPRSSVQNIWDVLASVGQYASDSSLGGNVNWQPLVPPDRPPLTASVWLRMEAPVTLSVAIKAELVAYYSYATGATIASTITRASVPFSTTSTGWVQVAVTLPAAPADAYTMTTYLVLGSAVTGTNIASVPAGLGVIVQDAAIITLDPENPVPDASYFDGDFTDTTDRVYEWTGDPHSFRSTSVDRPRAGTDPPPSGGPGAPPAVKVSPLTAGGAATIPPGPLVNPEAWAMLPRTFPGGAPWTWEASVWTTGAAVTVQPVEHTTAAGAPVDVGYPTESAGVAGQWVRVTGTFTPSSTGSWVGLQLRGPAVFYVDDVRMLAPTSSLAGDVVVFSGRVTDLAAKYVPEELDEAGTMVQAGQLEVAVTAIDTLGDFENLKIGDTPWPAQTIGARVARIEALAGGVVPFNVDATAAPLTVTRRDVDSQPVATLLRELAISSDSVLLAVADENGAAVVLRDSTGRPELLTLGTGSASSAVTIIPTDDANFSTTVPACLIGLDLEWQVSSDDAVTQAAVTWKDQTTSPDPTERTQTITTGNAVLVGTRRVSVGTQLATSGDAYALATSILARTAGGGTDWRVAGLTWSIGEDMVDTDPVLLAGARNLLSVSSRFGYGLVVTDAGDWSPNGTRMPVYVEGGTYSFDAGGWVLELDVSTYAGNGGSYTYEQLNPAWSYENFAVGLTVAQLAGVGYGGN